MFLEKRRASAIADVIGCVRSIVDAGPFERGMLDLIRVRMDRLAADQSLWAADQYPDPSESETSRHFRVGGEDNGGITLYLNVMRAGRVVGPHDHDSWAVIAPVCGRERHTLYKRTDTGSVTDGAILQTSGSVDVEPGASLVMRAREIHAVRVDGDEIVRHLHLYGEALETQRHRTRYHHVAGIYRMAGIETAEVEEMQANAV